MTARNDGLSETSVFSPFSLSDLQSSGSMRAHLPGSYIPPVWTRKVPLQLSLASSSLAHSPASTARLDAFLHFSLQSHPKRAPRLH